MIFIPGGEKLQFEEERHIYTYEGVVLDSVNTVIHKYSTPFDPDGSITARKAAENNITVEEQRKRWDKIGEESRTRGTAFHNDIESYIKTKKIPETINKDLIQQFARMKLKGVLFSEVRLHNLSYGIAGTTDLIQLQNNSASLWDYKTNQAKKMSRFSWGRKMLYPLNHIWDSTIDKYELQLSTYAFMLEEAGWWINEIKIIHVDQEKRVLREIPLQNRREDVIIMLEHYLENKYKLLGK